MRRLCKYFILIVGILSVAISIGVLVDRNKTITLHEITMDSYLTITFPKKHQIIIEEDLIGDFKVLEKMFNRYDNHSLLAKVNKFAYQEAIAVPEEFLELVSKSMELSDFTRGYFNPAIGKLVDIWREVIFSDQIKVPTKEVVEAVFKTTKMSDIMINMAESRISLLNPEISLDYGAVVKGFAVDRAFALLRKNQVSRAVINAGGTVGVFGKPPDSHSWKIGVQHPRGDGVIGILSLPETTIVSTSGDYERFRIIDNHRYHHIINPFNGFPTTEIISVTIINPSGIVADALSTAVMAMGYQQGMAFLKNHSLSAIIITPDLKIHLTGDAQNFFQAEP